MIFVKKQFRRSDPFTIQENGIKSGKLKRSFGTWESAESQSSLTGRKETVGRSFDINKVYKISLALLLFFCLIIGRAGWLSVVRGDY